MKVSFIFVNSVSIRQHVSRDLRFTKNLNMKGKDIPVANVSIQQLNRDFLEDIKNPNIKQNVMTNSVTA